MVSVIVCNVKNDAHPYEQLDFNTNRKKNTNERPMLRTRLFGAICLVSIVSFVLVYIVC